MATHSDGKNSVGAGNERGVHPSSTSIQNESEPISDKGVDVTFRQQDIPTISIQEASSDSSHRGVDVTSRQQDIPTISIQEASSDSSHRDAPRNATERNPDDDQRYKRHTTRLQKLLKLYFYSAVKYNNNRCSFHFIYFVFMVMQLIKLSCITAQMFNFGYERGNFNSVVKRGHLTLKHLLLKDWDASWETPAYPPAHGDFAVYDIKDLKEKINHAAEQLYNAEEDAIGYYKRPDFDSVTAEIVYFDFGGFDTGPTNHGMLVTTKSFTVHVESHLNLTTNVTSYTYDVDTDFERNNLTEPIKRMLKFHLKFQINSVRVYIDRNKARCLSIDGKITFSDPDNNGQVKVDLVTIHERQICKDVGYDVPDVTIETVSRALIIIVLLLTFLSLFYTIACMAFGIFVFVNTRRYMKKYYLRFFEPEKYKESLTSSQSSASKMGTGQKDLPLKEYLRFIKGWDILVLVSDITIIAGNLGLELQMNDQWTVTSLDNFTVLLGLGCLFAWIGLLRYFKFNYKFHLLFNTLYASFWDVLAYLACICVLFVGYMSFGYVVLGPYHIKFETPTSTSETLFSMVNGDEIYATFALLQTDQTGGSLVPIVFKIYLGSFIAIFTIIVLNLLIALFTNAYDAIKKEYEEPDDPEESPVETALKQLLVSEDNQEKQVTGSVLQLLQSDRHRLSIGEDNFRTQLLRIVGLSKSKRTFILKRPKTIKTFINTKTLDVNVPEDEEVEPDRLCCCFVSCLFSCCGEDEKTFCLKT